jgi:hypothetical protein
MFICNTRYRFLLKEDPHRTNHGMNEFLDLFEFGGTRDGFRVSLKWNFLLFTQI